MGSALDQKWFYEEDAAYAMLEGIIWPNGPVCPHCGATDRMRPLHGKAHRPGLYKCYACRKQSRVTVGTVFESSHIELHKWLQAVYLMCSSKKGISSNQIARTLGVTVKTAWFMTHRIREAMRPNDAPLAPLGGNGEIVEIDETFIGQKREKRPRERGYSHKNAILTLVQRSGAARSFHVEGTKASDLLPIIKANVAPEAHVMTDEAGQYAHLGDHFAVHDFVRHAAGEYGRGAIYTNTVEGFYSVFKRGMKGIYQHCSEKHLHRYVTEFDFRYNSRVKLGVSDHGRAVRALAGAKGKRLTYKMPMGA